MILCGVFGIAALLLSLVALYAVCMHDVLTRRREFGIRLAVGATADSLRYIVLSNATQLGLRGAVIGTLMALFASRSLGTLMFGVTTTDWRVYTFAAVAVLIVALIAGVGPVLRAGAIDPAEVMRTE
jgi:ABC-type antimicrobial peptide transport system permease subunit